MDKEKKVLGSVYCHISNSGVTFSVVDEGFGPQIEIHSSAFGNINNVMKIMTDKYSLADIGKLFTDCSREKFSQDYCNKASASQPKYATDGSSEEKK